MTTSVHSSSRARRAGPAGESRRRHPRAVTTRRLLVIAMSVCTVAWAAACVPPVEQPPAGGPVTVTASSVTIAYGDEVPATTPSYTGLPTGQTQTTVPASCTTDATPTSPPGTYATVCTGADQPGSTITYVDGTVTITPAPVTVTASSASMDFGGAVPTITASYDGLKNGDVAPAVLPECSTTATSSSPAGTYPSSCAGADDPNYSFTYVDGVVGVGTTVVTVTASSPSSTYGSAAPAITATYSGLTGGETEPATPPTCSTTASSSSPVGTYPSSCSGAADPSHTFVYVDGTVTVDPAAAVVTAASATVHFNSPVPAVTPSYSGLVNGDSAPATPPTCSTTATDVSEAGTYPSTCSGAADPNYTFTYVDGVYTITTADVPVTVTAPSVTLTYGDDVPALTPTYSGFFGGQTSPDTEANCTTEATSSSPVGTYATTCSGADDPNYTFDYVAGTVTVTPKDATVTASSESFAYGGTVPEIEAAYSGLVNGDTAAATEPTCSTTATSSSPVGTYPSTCTGAADPNYTFSEVDGTVEVARAEAEVTASSAAMTYGGTVPAITASYTGLVNGDTAPAVAPTCSTTATSSSPVDSYASTCSGADDPNYTFSYSDGEVEVDPAAAVVTASSSSVVYGGSATVTPSYSGLVNGDTAPADAPTCSSTATSAPVGTYPSSCAGADDPNYTFTYVDGTVTVTPAAATITASSGGMTEGDAVPEITPSYSGLVNGDTAAATPPTCSTTATSASGPGNYTTACAGADDPNYTFTYVGGAFRVHPTAPLPLTVTATSADLELGATPPAITPIYSGLIPGDTAPSTPATCSTTATASSPIGQYATTCSGAADPDYDITYVSGNIAVHPSDGYAEYDPTALGTTITAASNGASVSATTINVASTAGFGTYQNLTIETVANGAQALFCKTPNGTSFSTCSSNGATGTMATGGWVSNAAMSRFDVYTVAGGKANLAAGSVTILSDVPAAQRGMTSRVTADANNGVITYVQSAAPTGTFDLTYGICRSGTTTYSASSPNCSTGVIHYNPGVTSDIGADVTVLSVTNHTYQKIDTAVTGPSTVNPNQVFKVRVAPAPGAVPRLQPSSLGDATVNNSQRFSNTYPIPAGFTVQSFRLIGGDATSTSATAANAATATLCTTFNSGACTAKAASGNYINNSQPYIVVALPNGASLPGGRQITMPTLEVTLKATGASGTIGNFKLTEVLNITSATLIVGTTATFDGYPTNPVNLNATPPVGTPAILGTVKIN
ncbi:MBG domain-containing protein [Dermatobacter hominis]|uniref:MBG domain-containing protein n=1 Tax=Dermatobacter hominis TaxID=2884263 RepID=UPI001D12AF8A|nr:MBG domain-containing protein [Dermatobacter hominis]UDY34985.1 hypothetical protein LH044_16800 [Dermatobacter hominis]